MVSPTVIAASIAAAGAAAAAGIQAGSAKSASGKASKASTLANQENIKKQMEMYNLSAEEQATALKMINSYQTSLQQQVTGNQTPYADLGNTGLSKLNYGMGVNKLQGPTDQQKTNYSNYQTDKKNQTAKIATLQANIAAARAKGIDTSKLTAQLSTVQANLQNTENKIANSATTAYNNKLVAQQNDPKFGGMDRSFSDATGKQYPAFTPFDKASPTFNTLGNAPEATPYKTAPEFKALDQSVPQYTNYKDAPQFQAYDKAMPTAQAYGQAMPGAPDLGSGPAVTAYGQPLPQYKAYDKAIPEYSSYKDAPEYQAFTDAIPKWTPTT